MTAKRFKVHSLTGRIDKTRMLRAFKAVKRNRGAAGVDGVTVEMFEANLESNPTKRRGLFRLMSLMYDLKHRGAYHAQPVRRVYIPKGNGKQRPLGIPTVRDRVAQEVVRSLLESVFEPTFADGSFGFRPGRNAHQAVEEVLHLLDSVGQVVVDADIQSFFDNLPHELIIDRVAEQVADGNVLGLLREFLTAQVLEDGQLHPSDKGTPQGGVISPLLANVVLDVLDQRLTQAGFRLVRYADDFVVVCPTVASAEQALALVTQTLKELGLSLAPDKTRVTTFRKGFHFLGFHFAVKGVTVRDKSMEKFKDQVRALTRRHHNFDPDAIQALNRVITGFAHYFAAPFASVRTQFWKLDEWIRLRLRCMKLKRISKLDNWRVLNKHLARLGLVSLYRHALHT
jgi:group II intron reverse transcriptase/maturase